MNSKQVQTGTDISTGVLIQNYLVIFIVMSYVLNIYTQKQICMRHNISLQQESNSQGDKGHSKEVNPEERVHCFVELRQGVLA